MSDPLADTVRLLKPSTSLSKLVFAGGAWAVRRSDDGRPFYCAVLEGTCRLLVAGENLLVLDSGDFVLVPAAFEFEMTSLVPPIRGVESPPVETSPGAFRLGDPSGPPQVRMVVGHFAFGSDDADLLVSLLPRLIRVCGQDRLTTLLGLVNEETRGDRPGRDTVLGHLLEVMLIEALRSTTGSSAPPGLLRGLADARLAGALRRMHDDPSRAWTMAELARAAALSRSTLFERFRHEVGVAPMQYLLSWRMALAKDLLGREGNGVARTAERVGYSSASTFSVAFARHVGVPPIVYARKKRDERRSA